MALLLPPSTMTIREDTPTHGTEVLLQTLETQVDLLKLITVILTTDQQWQSPPMY